MSNFLSYYDLDNLDMNKIELVIDESMPVYVYDEPTPIQKQKMSLTGITYHLRFTFRGSYDTDPADLSCQKLFARKVSSVIKPYVENDVWVLGVEHFKKGMAVATPHIHMVFVSRFDKETIRKQFIRKMEEDDKGCVSGNKIYSLKAEVENNVKIWRYPLKQQKNDTKRISIYGSNYEKYCVENFNKDVKEMRNDAYAIWTMACEVSNAKEQHSLDKCELFDRLVYYLDKLDKFDDVSLKIAIQKFYIEEEKKPFNKTTATGYMLNYKITKGLMTHEQLALTW